MEVGAVGLKFTFTRRVAVGKTWQMYLNFWF